MFQISIWPSDHSPGFNKQHVPHKMAELALNVSHRYSSDHISKAKHKEYRYLLSLLRKSGVHRNKRNNTKLCTAMIPATNSWTDIECTRQFINATFLCKYTPRPGEKQDTDEDCRDSNHDYYCENGWVWGYKTCLKLVHLEKKYVTKDTLQSACKQIGANSMHDNINQVNVFMKQVLSYQGFSFIIVLREHEKVRLYISANSISEVTGFQMSSTIDIPFNIKTSQEVGVVCFKVPLPIQHSCQDGYKPCSNGECIVETYFCDLKQHCTDGSDEFNCTNNCMDGSLHFTCQDGSCIPISRLCDLIPDCQNGEDEEECPHISQYNKHWSPLLNKRQEQLCVKTESNALNSMMYQQCNDTCSKVVYPGKYFNFTYIDYFNYICPFGSSICHPKAYDCVYDKDFFGNVIPCKEAWQFQTCPTETQCDNLYCKDKYLCQNQNWCIPYRLVCNGFPECTMGDDEFNCTTWTCKKMLRCSKEKICVHPAELCDGILHCPLSGDDEAVCARKCPSSCSCLGRALLCKNPFIIEQNSFSIAVIRLGQTNFEKIYLPVAWLVDISHSLINNMLPIQKLNAPQLVKLNLGHNPLKRFSSRLVQFNKLEYIYMDYSELDTISDDTFSYFSRLVLISVRNTQVYHVDICAFCRLNKLQHIDLTNTHLLHMSTTIFQGIHSLQVLHISSKSLETVSKDFLMMNLSKFSTTNLNLCCLKRNVIIEQCQNFSAAQQQELCPFHYPERTELALLYLVLVAFMNMVGMQNSYQSMRISYFSLIFYNSMNNLFITCLMITFHFEQHVGSTSENLVIDFVETVKCKIIAKGTLLLRILTPFLATLLYYEMYRTLKTHKKNCNKQYVSLLASVISLMIVVIQNTGKEKIPSPVCMMKLNMAEKSVVLAVQGLICLVMTAIHVMLSIHIRQTGKARGNQEPSDDRQIFVRLTIYNSVMLLSLILQCIEFLVEINNSAVYLTIFLLQFTLAPLAFPAIFVLSTRQFKQKIMRVFRKSQLETETIGLSMISQ